MSNFSTDPTARADSLMTGEGEIADLGQAIDLYTQAMHAGSAVAAHRLAVIAALGVGCQANWDEALTHLKTAASLGHPTAQRQLDLIGSGPLFLDVGAQAANHDPAIIVLDAVVPRAFCEWIIEQGRHRLKPGLVTHISSGAPTPDPMRTAEAAHFQLFDMDLVLALTLERIARATGLPVHTFEPANLLHYERSQEYKAHFDFINPAVPSFRDQLALLGQRIATALVYLNDDYEGGETAFPNLQFKFKGAPGDTLVFFNIGADGQPHRDSLHAGLPPTRGEKWVLSIWVRDRVQPIF